MKQKTNKITLIIAKKGVGKSTIAGALSLAQPKKVFWITPIPKSYPKRKYDIENYHRLNIWDNMQSCFIVETEREKLDSHLTRIMNISRKLDNGACLVIDELDFYVNSHLHNQTKLFEAINYGRHIQLDLIVIARRIQDIPANLASNCDFFILGKNANLDNDTKYYKQFFNQQVIELSKSLDKGQFYSIEQNTQNIQKIEINEKIALELFREVEK